MQILFCKFLNIFYRFIDYRKPPCSLSPRLGCDDAYGVTDLWWTVLAFRLGFVVVFAVII